MKVEKLTSPITPVEAARRLGTQLDATYRLIWVGKLRGQKKAGKWLVDPASVEERLRAREKRNAPHELKSKAKVQSPTDAGAFGTAATNGQGGSRQ